MGALRGDHLRSADSGVNSVEWVPVHGSREDHRAEFSVLLREDRLEEFALVGNQGLREFANLHILGEVIDVADCAVHFLVPFLCGLRLYYSSSFSDFKRSFLLAPHEPGDILLDFHPDLVRIADVVNRLDVADNLGMPVDEVHNRPILLNLVILEHNFLLSSYASIIPSLLVKSNEDFTVSRTRNTFRRRSP